MDNNDIIEECDDMNNDKKIIKRGRKRDSARDYYVIKDNKLMCIVEKCNITFSSNTSISVLKRHIKKYHNIILVNKDEQYNNKDDNIDEDNLDEEGVYNLFSIAFAKKSLPYSLIEDERFKSALIAYNKVPNLMMTAYKLKEKTLINGDKICKDIINNLSKSKIPTTIVIDGWTNTRSNKVTNILLMSNGYANFYSSIENYTSKNDTEWLVSQLEIKINDLIKDKIIIVAITTDNENLMKATCQKLKEKFPVLIDMPCCSHLLQLCLKSICSVKGIDNIIREVLNIIHTIDNTKSNVIKLENFQKVDGISIPLKIIIPTMIRWGSIITSIDRLLCLRKYIELILPDIDKSIWDKINELFLYIKPFKNYIDKSQKNNVSICSVSKNIEELINNLNNAKLPLYLSKNKKNIIDTIKNKWNKHINTTIINVALFFDFDEKIIIDNDMITFIENWGSIYLTTYELIKEKDINIIKGIINLQIREFISKHSQFINLFTIINTIKNTCVIKKIDYNSIFVWSGFTTTHFELSTIAIGILSICPSEAAVERSFSMQSDIHSLDRNKLSSELIEAELRIKFNMNSL